MREERAADLEAERQQFEFELPQVLSWLPARADRILVIGRGACRWGPALAGRSRRVAVYERSERRLLELRGRIREDRLWNVAASPLHALAELEPGCSDVIFLSDLARDLRDGEFRHLSERVAALMRPGGRLVQRDLVSVVERLELRRGAVAVNGGTLPTIFRSESEIRAIHLRHGLVPVHAGYTGSERPADSWDPAVRVQIAVFDRG